MYVSLVEMFLVACDRDGSAGSLVSDELTSPGSRPVVHVILPRYTTPLTLSLVVPFAFLPKDLQSWRVKLAYENL
jgi:hypothetical protein